MAESIFSNFGAFLMAIIMTLFPYAGFRAPVMTTLEEDCCLNMTVISDIHLESTGIFRQSFLKAALRRVNNAKDNVDVIAVPGDITNYADEDTVALYYSIIKDYTDKPVITAAGNHDIGHAGDRDVTDISREEALANIVKYQNAYAGTNNPSNYYSQIVNGYKFIVIGDEVIDGGMWDGCSMTEEQLQFLDSELASGTADGKPVFVVCHWPVDHTVSEDFIWDGSSLDEDALQIKSTLEKYKNVVYISGHMHSGVKSSAVREKYGITSAEKVNGVIYLSLPSFGLVNTFGLSYWGTGAQVEIYKDKLIFRPMDYLTGNWFRNSECTFSFD